MAARVKRWVMASLASVALVALVTVLIKLVHPHGPARGLAVLYILAVLSVAVVYGPAFVSALLSVLTFDFFFLSPQQHLEVRGATGVETYVAFLATATMAGLLASRLRRQAVDAARLAAEQESHFSGQLVTSSATAGSLSPTGPAKRRVRPGSAAAARIPIAEKPAPSQTACLKWWTKVCADV
jgi:K+-sensing histidine kinase KdpD